MDGAGPVNIKLQWACAFARLGFKIFPCKAGEKVPISGQPWKEIATTDAAQITAWFTDTGLNYGMNPPPDIVIIDEDIKGDKHGDLVLTDLQGADIGDWIRDGATLTVLTPSGGHHYFLRVPFPAALAHSFPDGVDVRGPGGYVLGPGSKLPTGVYRIEHKIKMIEAPKWVVDRLKRIGERDPNAPEALVELDLPDAIARAKQLLRSRKPAVEGQGGDEHTLVTAGLVGDLGVSEETCYDLMLEIFNPRCEPEWDPMTLRVKVENSYRYRTRPLGCKACSLMDVFDAAAAAHQEPPANEQVDLPDDGSAKLDEAHQNRLQQFRVQLYDEYAHQPPPEWLIEGLIPRQGVGILAGSKGVYKTFVAIEIGMSIVAGRPFGANEEIGYTGLPFVRRDDDGPAYVVHVAGEGRRDIETVRIPAWVAHHKLDPAAARPYGVAGAFPRPDSENDPDLFIRALREGQPPGSRLAMVVFDTTARLMRGLDENSARDAGKAIAIADKISEELGCFVLLIHHTKKDGTAHRGSSVLEDDPGVSLRLARVSADTVLLSNPFQREGGQAPDIYLKARGVCVETSGGTRQTLVIERAAQPKSKGVAPTHVDPMTLPGLPGEVARALANAATELTTEQLADSISQTRAHNATEAGHPVGHAGRDQEKAALNAMLGRATRNRLSPRTGQPVMSSLSPFFYRLGEGGAARWRSQVNLMDKVKARGKTATDAPHLEFLDPEKD